MNPFKKRIRFAILALVFSVHASLVRAEVGLPRYKLEPGLEFRYSGKSTFQYERGGFDTEIEWTGWVTRKNADGSYRVIFRQSTSMAMRDNQKQKPSSSPPRVNLVAHDVFPDGRLRLNEFTGIDLDPCSILPCLPENADQVENGWRSKGLTSGSSITAKLKTKGETSGDAWVFDVDQKGIMSTIYESTNESTFTMDAKLGLIRRSEGRNTQRYGIKGDGSSKLELVSVERHDANWAKQFTEDADRYFAASRKREDALAKAVKAKDAQDVQKLVAEAESLLNRAREEIKTPIFRERIEQELEHQRKMASRYVDDAKTYREFIGQPAADWVSKDLSDQPRAFKDYRGKVLILDFWSRGCGWCVEAMPQVKQLADDFKDRPVAVLGMNTDQDLEDARFVEKTVGLNYPSIRAVDLAEKYQVKAFPTLIVVDKEGKIADVHIGYSPTLRAEVSATVEHLLNK